MREEDEVWSIDPLPISKNHHPRRNDDDFSCDFKIPFQDSKSNEIKLKGNNLRSTDELSAWADSLSREQLTSFLKLMKSKQGNWNNILPKEPSFDLSVNLERGGNNVVGRNRKEGGESEDDLLSLDLPSENSSSHSPPSKRKKSGKISTRSSSFHQTKNDDNSDKIELSMNTSPPISSRRKTREKKEKEKNNKGETSQKKHKLLDRFKSSSHQYDLTKSSLLRCSFQNQSLKLDHEKEKKLEDLSAINDKINEYQLNEYVKGIKSVKSATSDIIEQVVEKVLEDEELRNYIGNQLYLPEDRNGRKKFLSQVLMDPSTSNMRPFLSDQRIKDILQNKRTKEGLIPCLILQDGDPVHIPFTENEKNLVSKIEEKIKLDDPEEVIEMMAQIIPGRNLEDCKRYYLGKLKGELNGFTFTEEKVILYKRPEKMETDSPRGLFELTRQLRTFSHKHKNPIAMQRIGRNSVFKQFKSISSSTLASGQIVDCKFHPSQYKVATASTDTPYEAVLYDLKTGRAIALEGHGNTVGDIHFSNDGEYIITGSYDKTVRTWSSETGKACFVMKKSDDSPGHGDGVNVLVPHPKQNHIVASAAMDKTLFVWNIQRGSCEQTFGRFKPKYPIMTMCFSGPTLFVGFDSTDDAKEKSKILGMDISSGKRVVKMREQYGTICSMSTNQDGNLLLSAAADQTVRLYDVRDNHSSIIFKTLQSDVNKTTFSPCERYIQSSGTNNKTIIFDSRFPSNALHMLEHPSIAGSETQGVLAVEWSSDGLLATSGEDAVIRLWDIRLGKPEIFKLTGHTSIVNCLAFSHDDRMMVSGSSGQQVMLWGLESDPYSISAGRVVNDNAPA